MPVGRDYLRKRMRKRDTTVTALARELGGARKHLSNMLNGHAPLIDPLPHRLCRALLVSPAFLMCLLDGGLRGEPAPHRFMKGSVVWHDDLTEPMEDWEMVEDRCRFDRKILAYGRLGHVQTIACWASLRPSVRA